MKISPKKLRSLHRRIRQSKQVRFRTSSGILRILDVCHRSSGRSFLHSNVRYIPDCVAKSRFAPVIKPSAGCRRGFRVKM